MRTRARLGKAKAIQPRLCVLRARSPSGVAGEEVLSRFTNGKVNALVRPYGEGGVCVVGTHPEADRSWYGPKLWAQDEDGLDAAQGLSLIEHRVYPKA